MTKSEETKPVQTLERAWTAHLLGMTVELQSSMPWLNVEKLYCADCRSVVDASHDGFYTDCCGAVFMNRNELAEEHCEGDNR